MITRGLVSVTFRNKTPEEICVLCNKAGLRAIEWGGDIHVPAGDVERAREVRALSAAHGIEICAYGSYFRVGDDISEFGKCLATAEALGAPLIRVWCGRKGSAEASESYRAFINSQLAEMCRMAEAHAIDVALEFHGGTLTDSPESIERLLTETAAICNLRFYWQPRWDWDESTRLDTLRAVLPRLAYIHTFTWEHTPDIDRLALERGADMWKKALSIAGDAYALIEFVRDDSDASLLDDAAALRRWTEELEDK